MKKKSFPGLLDLFEVSDPNEIKAITHDPQIDRRFEMARYPVNWLLLKRSLSVCFRFVDGASQR